MPEDCNMTIFHYGNPLFDLGMVHLICNYNSPEYTNMMFHTTNDVVAAVWKIFVREYFPSKQLEEVNRILDPFAALMFVYFSSRGNLSEEADRLIRRTLL